MDFFNSMNNRSYPVAPTMPVRKRPVVVFAIPGQQFSHQFVISWTKFLLSMLESQKYDIVFTNNYNANIYHCRANLLGASNQAGVSQRPWQGQLKYDYIFFIDSDQVFEPDHIYRMLDQMEKNKHVEVLSGMCVMADNTHTPIVLDWDIEFFKKNARFEYRTPQELIDRAKQSSNGLIEAFHAGFAFLVVRQGVFERIAYPWFEPAFHKIDQSYDFSSEDVSWYHKINKAGIKLWIDPGTYIGHEKSIVMRPPVKP
jgi:hypothetical protein